MVAATFPNIPPHTASPGQDIQLRTLEATFGDNYVQSSGDGINAELETWNLTWEN